MNRTTARTARKPHRCMTALCHIHPGDRYLEMVASPDHDDLGNLGWMRSAECANCAHRYGREHLLTEGDPQ